MGFLTTRRDLQELFKTETGFQWLANCFRVG